MKLQKKMAVGKNLPTLAIGAGYNYHNLLDNDRAFAMAFATVSVPITDWWGGSHAIKRRRLELQKAEDQLRDGDELLRIRMQKAYNDVVEAEQQLQLAQRGVEQADENLRLHRAYYRAGTATMSNLLEAQLLYQQTLDRHTDAYADLQKFRFSRLETNLFRGIFVFLHQNSKRKEIMPEICHFYGIVITMYLPDHNPPHFHVRYNEFRATIDIKTGNVTGQMPRRALNLVFEWLDQHKDELMANWERMENGESLVKINPLD